MMTKAPIGLQDLRRRICNLPIGSLYFAMVQFLGRVTAPLGILGQMFLGRELYNVLKKNPKIFTLDTSEETLPKKKIKVNKYKSYFDTEQLKRDMKRRAVQGGMLTTASQGILFVLRLASIMVLARMIIPEHFGLIGMVTSLTVLIERFQDIGLGDAIVQRKDITHEQVSTLFWITGGICICLTTLVVLFAKAVAWFYNDSRLIWITVALSSNFIFSGMAIQHMALIRRRMRFDHFALVRILSTTFSLIVAIALAWSGCGYWALVWKELTRTLSATALAWSFCSWRPGLPRRNAGISSMVKFGANITGYNMLYYLSNNLDAILIGRFCGATPVGIYSRAKQLTTVPANQLLEPIRYVSLPTLSALQNDPAKYRNYFEKMLAILSFLYMPTIVYIGIYAHPIVYIALGPQWMDAVSIFRLLAISMFATPVIALLGMLMLSYGHSKRYFLWGLFTSTVIVIGFVVGIRWGAIGIAASCSIATAINMVFSLFFVFKDSPVGAVLTLKALYKPAIASIGMGIVLLLSYAQLTTFKVILQILFSTLLGGAVYLSIWTLFPGGYKNIIKFLSYPKLILKTKRTSRANEAR